MDELYLKFFNAVHGKPIEVEDPNNLDQCFDLAFYWTDMLGIPRAAIRHLYAYEIFTGATDTTRQYFDIIPHSDTFIPQKGDLGVFGTGVGVAGHVCVCNGHGDTHTFESEDQNWNGHKYAELITHNYNSFLGVLRPKAIPTPVQTSTTVPVDSQTFTKLVHNSEVSDRVNDYLSLPHNSDFDPAIKMALDGLKPHIAIFPAANRPLAVSTSSANSTLPTTSAVNQPNLDGSNNTSSVSGSNANWIISLFHRIFG